MRLPLMGVGLAGLISALAFTFFPLDGSLTLRAWDLQNTFGFLGIMFGTILLAGLASGVRTTRLGRSHGPGSGSMWSRDCPRCGHRATRRTCFCPSCGFTM